MPYCPTCDMEFIHGVTTCTDCGEPLVPSKEFAEAKKRQESEEALIKQQEELEAMQAEYDLEENDQGSSASYLGMSGTQRKGTSKPHPIYVKKAQQYEDLKSSASAFVLVGSAMLIFSLLCWFQIINLPLAGASKMISQGIMSAMGVAALLVAFSSGASAKKVKSQIAGEEQATKQLLQWFLDHHTGQTLDAQILTECGDLGPEERSLKRFQLIQDIFITNHDIADQAYVDLITEEVYGELYQD